MLRNLETHRFDIKPESLGLMKHMKKILEKIREVAPKEVLGISYFGSRIRARERFKQGINRSSDLDMCIYYDGSKLEPDKKDKIIESLKFLYEEVMYNSGLEVTPADTVLTVDASQEETNKELAFFRSNIQQATKNFTKIFDLEHNYADIGRSNFRLISCFFLGVGDGLYKNRGYILDQLEADKEHGEIYFNALMQFLQFCERIKANEKNAEKLPKYQNYPKTIEEARKYFLIQEAES